MRRSLMGKYHDETFNLLEMRVSSWKRSANLPTLDGLFGGKPCFREWADKSKLSLEMLSNTDHHFRAADREEGQ